MKKVYSVIKGSLLLILSLSVFLWTPSENVKAKDTANRRLVTPPLFVQGASIFACTALNVSAKPIVVDIQVYSQDGTQECGVGGQEIGQGETAVQLCNSDIRSDHGAVRYCEISYNGGQGLVLGTAQFDPPSSATAGVGPAVVAVEVK